LYVIKATYHHWKLWIYCACILIIYSILSSPTTFATSLIVDADAQYRFAQKLFQQKAYTSAISELQRFIHFFPDDRRIPAATKYIGKSFFQSGRYKEAINVFQNLIDRYQGDQDALLAYFDISECYLKLQQPQQAYITLKNFTSISKDPDMLDRAYYRMGWIAIDIGGWQDATNSLAKISPQFRKDKSIDDLTKTLKADKPIALKHPKLSGALSVIPGLGQLYCGRYKDALSAFFVNTALIWAAAESFNNELYALGTTISIFEAGFYTGNIYGATTSAHKYNQTQIKAYIRQLHKQYQIGLLPTTQNDGIMLTFQYVY
jgi:tetratricopeptide (TPR) repeat protein